MLNTRGEQPKCFHVVVHCRAFYSDPTLSPHSSNSVRTMCSKVGHRQSASSGGQWQPVFVPQCLQCLSPRCFGSVCTLSGHCPRLFPDNPTIFPQCDTRTLLSHCSHAAHGPHTARSSQDNHASDMMDRRVGMIMLLSFVGCSLECAHSASYCDDGALCAIVVA